MSAAKDDAFRTVVGNLREQLKAAGVTGVSTIRWAAIVTTIDDRYEAKLVTVGSVAGGIEREKTTVTSLAEARDWIRKWYPTFWPTLVFFDTKADCERRLIFATTEDLSGYRVVAGRTVFALYSTIPSQEAAAAA